MINVPFAVFLEAVLHRMLSCAQPDKYTKYKNGGGIYLEFFQL